MTWRCAPFSAIERPSYGRSCIGCENACEIIGRDYVGGLLVVRGWHRKDVGARCMPRGARVSLSDWLALLGKGTEGQKTSAIGRLSRGWGCIGGENACEIIGRDYVRGLLVVRGWFRKDVGGTVRAVGCQG